MDDEDYFVQLDALARRVMSASKAGFKVERAKVGNGPARTVRCLSSSLNGFVLVVARFEGQKHVARKRLVTQSKVHDEISWIHVDTELN